MSNVASFKRKKYINILGILNGNLSHEILRETSLLLKY